MNITTEELRQIIKEETQAVLSEKIGLPDDLEKQAMDDYDAGKEPQSDDKKYLSAYNDYKEYIEAGQPIEFDEAKKKKACKPSKGKRFAKRVDGKCRSFGQKGQAKGGGDRIRPGTKKGDAYCARSLKIKKCKNPPCANALSRKKWKCKGAKSMK